MITIVGEVETTTVIKKSRFIGFACAVNDEAHAQEIISARKKQHYDASHNCFAFVLENGVMRYSDDGEPQGTAGLPMLDVIRKKGLTDVLVVSTRYFGGTLLGAGGLVRAYTGSAASALDVAQKIEVITCNVFKTTFSYTDWSKAQKRLEERGFMVGNLDFSDTVQASLSAMPGSESELEKLVTSVSLGKSTLSPQGTQKIERKI
ncbi:MAG: YigZ family protein [Clostridia bacterium]|jgi:uncharacterized YigZ family protein|nr:YigZ family protein [Clostridia bacterium]MBT7122550.1 YigZ family protein [Clostridia bacterium]